MNKPETQNNSGFSFHEKLTVEDKLIIQANGLNKTFGEGKSRIQVLDNASFTLEAAQTVAIVGASGSGKSTLLHLLGGLDKPDTGDVTIDSTPLASLNEAQLSDFRNEKLGFVYQFHHLLPEFTALENVAMPLIIRRMSRAQAYVIAQAMLVRVGMASRVSHLPGQLSGGERQRVALARALVTGPRCVLADEPTGNLDRRTAAQVFDLLRQLNRDLGIAFVLVTHDVALAERTDKVLQMIDGRLY